MKMASELRDKGYQKRWTNQSSGRLERIVMLSCYAARKLSESGHIKNDSFQAELDLRVYKSHDGSFPLDDWTRPDVYYDLSKWSHEKRAFSFVCNQIIHSKIFLPVLKSGSDKGLKGLVFNSDKTSRRSLYFVDLWDLIPILAKIGDGYIGKPTIFNVGPNGELSLAEEQE